MDSTAPKSTPLLIDKQKQLVSLINSGGIFFLTQSKGQIYSHYLIQNANNVQFNASLKPWQEIIPGIAVHMVKQMKLSG